MTDLKFAIRQLLKSPGLTAVAVISLALGIGANTAIFRLINAVLLRQLPVRNPHELRVVNWTGRNVNLSHYAGEGMGQALTGFAYGNSFSYPAYCEFRDRGAGLADVFAFHPLSEVTTLARGQAYVADGLMVSGNFFQGYGATTLIGRPLSPEDDRRGAPPAAVITYLSWERHFDLDPTVLGETITLNQHSFTVVGVLTEGYVGPLIGDPTDIYVPLTAQPQLAAGFPLDSPRHWWIRIMARLAPGARDAQAQASLAVLFPRALEASETRMEQPGIWLQDGSRGPLMTRQRVAGPMWALLAVVGLVLLIACANLATLLLARGAARQHEMAVRAAIGADRWRLMRQSFAESLVLALAGGGLGWVLASWGKAGLMWTLSVAQGDLSFDTRMDFNVLAFTFGVAVVTAGLFGFLPALRAAKVDPAIGLRERSDFGPLRLRTGKALVSLQVALSVVLVVGASLVIQTFANLTRAQPGFSTENLLLFRLNPERAGYQEHDIARFFERTAQSLSAIPGVREVAYSDLVLVGGAESGDMVSVPGSAAGTENRLQTSQLVVSDSFFSTMGLPLVLGREFNSGDTRLSPCVAIVNETFARAAFEEGNPVGRSVTMGDREYQIVAVCRDASYKDLRSGVPPMMYRCHRQATSGAMYLEVRSVLPPLSLVPAVRKAIAAIDPSLPITDLKTQKQVLEMSITPERIIAWLCGFLALLAVLLSCIGIYGLVAYRVARRTGEIGIRIALGARPRDVGRSVVWEALALAGRGLVVGVPLALALAQGLRHFLFGIQPHDPVTLIGGMTVMTAVAVLAAWIPARRAMKVDPMVALRGE